MYSCNTHCVSGLCLTARGSLSARGWGDAHLRKQMEDLQDETTAANEEGRMNYCQHIVEHACSNGKTAQPPIAHIRQA